MTDIKLLEEKEGIKLKLHVYPGARKDGILGIQGGVLRVNIASPPVRGAANRRLRKFLAKSLNLFPSRVEIVSGHTSRHKTVRIIGLSRNDVMALLGQNEEEKGLLQKPGVRSQEPE